MIGGATRAERQVGKEDDMDAKMLRIWFVGCLAALLACADLGFVACSAEEEDGWEIAKDDSLPCLTTQVAGGSVVAMPGDGWIARDGYIQVQLSGSSTDTRKVSVGVEGGTLVLNLRGSGDATTLDLVCSEYRVAGGDVPSINKVVIRNAVGGGERILEKAFG